MSESSRPPETTVNRRTFLKGLGTSAVAVASAQAGAMADEIGKMAGPGPQGPGAVPVVLNINGKNTSFQIEPRVTLLDALRNYGPLTGAKEVCDRATCGACSVLVDGKLVYSCMKLAIDAQGTKITTIEGLAQNGQLTKVQEAFVECDALMCGFCTPGMVLATTALLASNPKPTMDEIKRGCSGNLCRCGTYPHVIKAALKASGQSVTDNITVLKYERVA
ncbi:MAG TPA: (2Fe-2S)-binding protein [Candidatus Methylacidiphilales bacterium]|nr:(2Fe-2S)-binding protein [Candidatus Methylacidiphilales bacterium]